MDNKLTDVVLQKKPHPFVFSKSSRLLTASDYKSVFDAVDFKIHQPHLMCLVSVHRHANKTPSDATSRLGMAISKAKNKRANERNRIKRLIREYFRLHQHELPESVSVVFLTKSRTDALSNAELQHQLAVIWQKLKKRLS